MSFNLKLSDGNTVLLTKCFCMLERKKWAELEIVQIAIGEYV